MASLSLLKGLKPTNTNQLNGYIYIFFLKQMDKKLHCSREEKNKQYGLEGVNPHPKHHAKA
jgi:hypothetical protein